MFMGSQHVPVGAFRSDAQSRPAPTTMDRPPRTGPITTRTLPSNALALALWLDSDRMGFLLPTMDLAKVDLQRDVVKNERETTRRQRTVHGRADEIILAALYPKAHPYSWPVIGSMADLSAASLARCSELLQDILRAQQCYAHHRRRLRSGDSEEARRTVFREHPAWPGGEASSNGPNAVTIPRDTFLVLEDKVQLPRLFYTWHTVKRLLAR